MKTKRHVVLYVLGLPWDLFLGWPMVLLARLFWGENLSWESTPKGEPGGPVLTCSFKKGSWPNRTWYAKWGGTTVGHAIVYNHDQRYPGSWSEVQRHEHVHVEQFEGVCASSFLVGLGVGVTVAALGHPGAGAIIGVVLWWAGYLIMGIGNYAAAWLRGEDPYRGSSHEESAYAQDGRGPNG